MCVRVCVRVLVYARASILYENSEKFPAANGPRARERAIVLN